MSFAIFVAFACTPRSGQRFGVYSKLCNKFVGSVALGNTFGNPECLAVELHRQVYLCLSSKATEEDKFQNLPRQFLKVFVGQTELEHCTLSLSSLSQHKISFVWDMQDFDNALQSEPKQFPLDAVRDAHTVHYKNLCLDANSLRQLKKLKKLQKVYITNASFRIMANNAPLWTLLPTNLTDLYVSNIQLFSRPHLERNP